MRYPLLIILATISCVSIAQTPEATVQRFVAAISKKDLQTAAACVKGGQVTPELTALVSRDKQWPTFAVSQVRSKVAGGSTIVTYRLALTGVQHGPAPAEESLTLTKSGNDWVIKPIKPDDAHDKWVMQTMAYMLANPQALKDNAALSYAMAKSMSCLSNVKQVGIAFIMFANDWDDIYKLNAENWQQKLMPYVKNRDIFTCPEDPKGTQSYSFNPKLANVKSANIKNPQLTVLVYEGKGGKPNFRHQGRAAVGFADGHAKLVTKDQAKSLVWKP